MNESTLKKPHQIIYVTLLLGVFITSCAPATIPATQVPTLEPIPTSTFVPSPTPLLDAQQYLSDAIDIIQKNALNSSKVDWVKVRSMAFIFEKNGKEPADTYDTVSYVLRQLGDKHSSFASPEMATQLNNSTVANYPAPEGKVLEDKIGYIAVFEFGAQEEDEMNTYADTIQNLIMELNQQSVCGWVVDLRENTGGNMYPMIAGLGALIGEGELGFFKNAQGETDPWFYRDGQSGEGNVPFAKVSHPEILFDPDKTPVAVLIGPQTASSGEATAISFRGRPNTRFFGKPSRGLTTGNQAFTLSDGAMILLTVVVELDRTGYEYSGSITPDVVTSNAESEATDWLLAQPACNQ